MTSFDDAYKKLVKDYKKTEPKSYLIALCILCQGYLSAHGGVGLAKWESLPERFRKNVQNRRTVTEQVSWWTGVIICTDNVRNEMSDILDKVNGNKVEALLDAIDKDSLSDKDDVVQLANAAIAELLTGK